MTTDLYVDNINCTALNGVYIADGGAAALFAIPHFKSLQYNDWQETDYREVDLSSPVLDNRTLSLNVTGHRAGIKDVITALDTHSAHVISIGGGVFSWKFMRYTGVGSLSMLRDICHVNIQLSQDRYVFPARDFIDMHVAESWSMYSPLESGVLSLGAWGIRVLQGWAVSAAEPSDPKPALLRDIDTVSGVIYDYNYGSTTHRERSLTLQCLMHGMTDSRLWANYNAFLEDVIQPGKRHLYDGQGSSWNCYYAGMEVLEFVPAVSPWLKFNIRFNITQ